MVAGDDRVVVLEDVDDDEKPLLMRGCAVYALPTRPEPDFVETFGIALAEKMLAGGGPVVTTLTCGTGEAVADTALIVGAVTSPGLRPCSTGPCWRSRPPSARAWRSGRWNTR